MFTNRIHVPSASRRSHVRIHRGACWLVVLGCIICQPVFGQRLIDERLPRTWQQESSLRDVHFIDAQHGWAVGDQGVILKTIDGGQHWSSIADVNRSVEDWHKAAGSMSLREKLQGVQGRRVQSIALNAASDSAPKVSCQLNSVFFLNRHEGWAAGGYAVPLLDLSRSVVLKTKDGGVTWRPIANTMPPHIKQIRFSDPRTGWAIGESSSSFQSGIFFTRDGGQTWQPQPLSDRRQRHDWARASRTNQAANPKLIGVSTTGLLKNSSDRRVENGGVLSSAKQNFNDVVMIDAAHGWAVGDNGAIFETQNEGLSWQVPSQLTDGDGINPVALVNLVGAIGAIGLIDFRSVAATDSTIWAAGKPGGCLVSINRQTGKVNLHPTPINTAINRVAFVDDQHGWAVGDLGIIISTNNGGESWQIQRGRRNRIGLLGVCFDNTELPLELLAQYACEDDVLFGVTGFDSTGTHFHHSANRCGSAVVDRISLPDVNDAAEQQAAVIRKLVTEIRTHRPDAIVLNPSIEQSVRDSIDREKLIQLAVHTAADATYETDRFKAINLKPWQVQRLAIADITGNMNASGDKFLPDLAATIGERIFISRSLLGLSSAAKDRQSQKLTYRVVRFLGRGAGGQSTTAVPVETDLLVGLQSVPRREKTQHPPGDLTMIGRRNQKQERFKRILGADVNDPSSMLSWQNEMIRQMPSTDRMTAGSGLMELAEACFAADKPELTAKTLDFLVQRLPDHAYAPSAMLWLSAYYASQEYSRRSFANTRQSEQRTHDSNVATAGFQNPVDRQALTNLANDRQALTNLANDRQALTNFAVNRQANGDKELVWSAPDKDLLARQIKEARQKRSAGDATVYTAEEQKLFELGDALVGKPEAAQSATPVELTDPIEPAAPNIPNTVTLATANAPVSSTLVSWQQFVQQRRQTSARYLARLRGQNLDLSLAEETVAVELTLLKESAQTEEAIERMQQLRKSVPGLSQTIGREMALLREESSANAVRCAEAKQRPKLDGQFEDAVWREALENKTDQQMPNSDVVCFAHDDKFLYLIARVNKQANYNYRFNKKRRTRDANLINRDRIEVQLDCDRDGRTGFQLTIDHRGWVNESFDATGDWDPQWYVSQSENEDSWTVEAAIPLSAFEFKDGSPEAVTVSQPWTIGLNRFVSGKNLWDEVRPTEADPRRSMLDLLKPSPAQKLFVFE